MLQRLKFEMSAMVDSMLDRRPSDLIINGRICDPAMGGGQFLRAVEARKRAAGKSSDEIRSTVLGVESNVMRRDYGVNRHGLVGTYVAEDTLGSAMSGMKFDVIIGNPPYNETESNSRKPLWPQFAALANDHLVDGGYLAFVSPPSWVVPKKNKSLDYGFYQNNQITAAHFFDDAAKKQHFSVGSEVSWYVIQKSPRTGATKVTQHLGNHTETHDLEFTFDRSLPKIYTKHSLGIHQKLLSATAVPWIYNLEFHNQRLRKRGDLSDTQTDHFANACYFSPVLKRYTHNKFTHFAPWKLMLGVTNTIDKAWIDSDCSVTEDVRYILMRDQQQAQNALSAFRTTLYRYIGAMYRQGRNMGGLDMIPQLDWDQTWTDDSVAAAVGLSPEELEYASDYIS